MTTNQTLKFFTPKLISITTVFLISAPNLVTLVEPSAQLISTQTQSGGLAPANSGGLKHLEFAFATTDASSATQVAETDGIVLHWHGNMPHYQEVGAGSPSALTPVRWEQTNKPCVGKKPGKRCK